VPATDLLLFVAGAPGPGPETMKDVTSRWKLLAGTVVVGWWSRARAGAPSGSDGTDADSSEALSWHLPAEQIHCVNLVAEIARDLGRSVTLVDVNRPMGAEDLIRRWAAADPVFPLLVRPDGRRLEGLDHFVPRELRRFVRGE
jgi:hypothetical protein